MPFDLTNALAKLDRPPAGHNWVRFVRGTKPETTKSILSFVKGVPKFTYHTGLTAIRDRFLLGIDLDAAISVTQRGGAPAGRQQNRELVQAFFDHDLVRSYPIGTCIEFEKQWFRISRELLVPVSPLVIMREHGKFVPVFLCGWSELSLDVSQRRLLMTIYEDAFLSLTDFQSSPAEFLFFPKVMDGHKKVRAPEIWTRGDYTLLPRSELNEQVEIYLAAREEARNILMLAKATQDKRRADELREADVGMKDDGGLFDDDEPQAK